eukprot:6186386-Pleurochrysis_carterae.AAC.3
MPSRTSYAILKMVIRKSLQTARTYKSIELPADSSSSVVPSGLLPCIFGVRIVRALAGAAAHASARACACAGASACARAIVSL